MWVSPLGILEYVWGNSLLTDGEPDTDIKKSNQTSQATGTAVHQISASWLPLHLLRSWELSVVLLKWFESGIYLFATLLIEAIMFRLVKCLWTGHKKVEFLTQSCSNISEVYSGRVGWNHLWDLKRTKA